MGTDPRKLPIWTGANGHSKEKVDPYEHPVSSFARGLRLYTLLQRTYVIPSIPSDTSRDDAIHWYSEHTMKIPSL